MPRTEDYAVVVGIDHYTRPPFGPLKGAVQDASDFAEWVKSPKGGDVPAGNVDPYTVKSTVGVDHPTYSALLTCLNRLVKKADENGRVGRRLYLFFAGHGVSPDARSLDDAGLVTVEAEEYLVPNLAGWECVNLFASLGSFEEVVLFMDCCRTSSALRQKFPLPFEVNPQNNAGQVKRFGVFAVPYGQVARESDVGGGKFRGIFSNMLLNRLNDPTGDANNNLTTTLLQAHLASEMLALPPAQRFQFMGQDEILLIEKLPGVATCDVMLEVAAPSKRVEILDGGAAFAVVATLLGGPANHKCSYAKLPRGKSYLCRAYLTDSTIKEDQFTADRAVHHVYL